MTSWLSKKLDLQKLKISFVAALIVVASFPPLSFYPFIFLAFVLFLWPLLKEPKIKAKTMFFYVFHFQLWINILGFYWMGWTFYEFAELGIVLSVLIALLLFVLQASVSAALSLVYLVFLRIRMPILLALFSWLLLDDYLALRFFPWSPYMAFGANKYLLASVFYLGSWGWSLVFFGSVILLLYIFSLKLSNKKLLTRLVPAMLFVTGLLFFTGYQAFDSLSKEHSYRQPVALLQGNIGNYQKKQQKLGIEPTIANVLDVHEELIQQVAVFFAQVATEEKLEPWIAWPETSFPGTPFSKNFSDQLSFERMLDMVKLTRGIHFIGTYSEKMDSWADREELLEFNTMAFLHENHSLLATYKKNLRIPMGEYVPGDRWWGAAYEYFPWVNHFGKGDEQKLFVHPDPKGPIFIPFICYEILFASYVDRFVQKAKREYPNRSLIIVNASNDSWYGPTAEPWLHSLLARWQSAKYGLAMLRPTNTGLSQVVAPWGEVLNQGPRDETLVIYGNLPVKQLQKR